MSPSYRERVTCMPSPSTNKAEPTLALKPRGDVTRSPNQEYRWPHKKSLCPPKIYFKKNAAIFVHKIKSIALDSSVCFHFNVDLN